MASRVTPQPHMREPFDPHFPAHGEGAIDDGFVGPRRGKDLRPVPFNAPRRRHTDAFVTSASPLFVIQQHYYMPTSASGRTNLCIRIMHTPAPTPGASFAHPGRARFSRLPRQRMGVWSGIKAPTHATPAIASCNGHGMRGGAEREEKRAPPHVTPAIASFFATATGCGEVRREKRREGLDARWSWLCSSRTLLDGKLTATRWVKAASSGSPIRTW